MPPPTSLSGISPLTWSERRVQVIDTRLKGAGQSTLLAAFDGVSCTEYTADYLYELPLEKTVLLMQHFITFPDDATRMQYLHPDDQRAELKRLIEVISDAPAKTPQG